MSIFGHSHDLSDYRRRLPLLGENHDRQRRRRWLTPAIWCLLFAGILAALIIPANCIGAQLP